MRVGPYALLVLLAVGALSAFATHPREKTVAVLRFDNNTGEERYQHLGRALAAMMISDLSAVDEITLVERERLDDVVAELDFQQSMYVDPATAQSVGLIAGAEFVVTGAFATVEPEMRLDSRVISVETTEIVKTASVTGQSDELFDLQLRLADELIDGLSIALSPEQREQLRAHQEANRIDDVETALAFSRALCYADAGNYVRALELMQEARGRAPGSRILGATLDLMQERAREEARRGLVDRAGRAIGGLVGRRGSVRSSRSIVC